MGVTSPLERFRRAVRRGFVFDFDGTLSEIVAHPEIARVVPGAPVLCSGGAAVMHTERPTRHAGGGLHLGATSTHPSAVMHDTRQPILAAACCSAPS